MRFRFIPDDWTLSDPLREWTKAKGLTDKTIEDELESFRDHEYKVPKSRPDACWRNWVKNGIRWGNIIPTQTPTYRTIDEVTPEQKARDLAAYEDQIKRFTNKP